jgi:hypothetical protein
MKKNKKDGQRDFAKGDLVDYKIYTLEEGLHEVYNPFTIIEIYTVLDPLDMIYKIYRIESANGVKSFDVHVEEICFSLAQMRDDKLKDLGI